MSIKTEAKVGIFVLAAVAVFAYFALHLGFFRFALKNYNSYYLNFQDIAGLVKKSDVKIAGVKVGWVENIKLDEDHARVKVAVKNEYRLHTNPI